MLTLTLNCGIHSATIHPPEYPSLAEIETTCIQFGATLRAVKQIELNIDTSACALQVVWCLEHSDREEPLKDGVCLVPDRGLQLLAGL